MQVERVLEFSISDRSFVAARYATTIYYTTTCEIAGGPKRFALLFKFGFNVLEIFMGIKLFKC